MAKVGIVMGSDSDMPVMKKAAEVLEQLGVEFEGFKSGGGDGGEHQTQNSEGGALDDPADGGREGC